MIASATPHVQDSTHPAKTYATIADRNEAFLRLLPTIQTHARIRFRHLPWTEREEAIQEVVARAFDAFVALVARHKGDRAFATPLAAYAVAGFKRGRRIATRLNRYDVTSRYCQLQTGASVECLQQWDEQTGEWQELLVEDRRSTPAETAALRIDIADWLATMPRRNRLITWLLAVGESTSLIAQRFGLTPGRISQMRRELHDSWCLFVADARELQTATRGVCA